MNNSATITHYQSPKISANRSAYQGFAWVTFAFANFAKYNLCRCYLRFKNVFVVKFLYIRDLGFGEMSTENLLLTR